MSTSGRLTLAHGTRFDRRAVHDPEIIRAVELGDFAAVERLLDAAIPPNASGQNGDTALMRAAAKGALDIAKLLLARGAQIDAVNDAGNTALMFACARGHAATARFLVENGARLDHRNRFGLGPADWARWAINRDEILELVSGANSR